MKALIFHEPERISVEDVAQPAAGPGEALLRVGATGICYSDIRVYHGKKHARHGVIPGHEIAGTIAQVGEGVERVRPGDRVAVFPIIACGACVYCRSGRRHRCLERRTLGYEENGGLAEHVLVPASLVSMGHLLPLPADIDMQRACLTEPLACVLNSVETCGVRAGTSLVLIGAGPMGLCHLVLARALGAGTIIVSEPDEERAAIARRLDASVVIDPRREELASVVRERTDGLGADAVIVTSGLSEVIETAIACTKRLGVTNLFAGFPPDARVSLDPNAIHYNEVRLTGSQNASPEQYRRALELLPHLPAIDEITTHRVPLANATEAYAARLRNEGLKSMVIVSAEA
ncbi:MAG: alcohol dehydrogenase catalytic domain-containing protein [Dehalococcoidia bacterium]